MRMTKNLACQASSGGCDGAAFTRGFSVNTGRLARRMGRMLAIAQVMAALMFGWGLQVRAGCVPPPAGLVGWWSGEGNAGDRLGANPGTPENGVRFLPGKVGDAFELDGVDDAVLIPHHPSLDPRTNSFTLQAWVRASFSSGTIVVAEKYECGEFCPNGASSVYGIEISAGFPLGTLRAGRANDVPQMIYGSRTIADGAFHHLVVCRDIEADRFRLYVDGVLGAESPLTESARGDIGDDDGSADPLIIGMHYVGGTSQRHGFLQGAIDEVALWNRALTGDEVSSVFAAGAAGMCTSPPPEPWIVRSPSGAVRAAGSAIELSVEATGTAPPWRIDGSGMATNCPGSRVPCSPWPISLQPTRGNMSSKSETLWVGRAACLRG